MLLDLLQGVPRVPRPYGASIMPVTAEELMIFKEARQVPPNALPIPLPNAHGAPSACSHDRPARRLCFANALQRQPPFIWFLQTGQRSCCGA